MQILASRGVDDTLESLMLKELEAFEYTEEEDACILQTFELTTLQVIRNYCPDVLRIGFA